MILKLVASRFVALAKAFTLAMSVWQLSRSPGQYTRLALLLMMAIAVGTYAASYSSTAERSYEDRANFESGVDVRAFPSGTSRIADPPDVIAQAAEELPGVLEASTVYRNIYGEISTPAGGGVRFQALGVDPTEVGDMLWFREDFSDVPLDQLLVQLEGPSDLTGKELPGMPMTLSVWVKPPPEANTTSMRARFRDAAGHNWIVDLDEIGNPGWNELTGVIMEADELDYYVAPIRLMSFEFYEPPNARRGAQKPIGLDDITVRDAAGTVTVVDDFERNATWTPLPQRAAVADGFLDADRGAPRRRPVRRVHLRREWLADRSAGHLRRRPRRPARGHHQQAVQRLDRAPAWGRAGSC
jgi:hypothetical protein